MTPIQRAINSANLSLSGQGPWDLLRRVILFVLVQMLTMMIIFWAGIFTLISAIWHGDANYMWIFLLLVSGFELLALRIVFRQRLLTVLGIIFLVCGMWLHHHDSTSYNERICRFIKNSTCHEFGDGFICRREFSSGDIMERTIGRDDIKACGALDEI